MRSVCLLVASAIGFASEADPAEQAAFFESKVRPLLVSKCYACHREVQAAALRLDSRAALLRGGQSGPAVVPGNPRDSLLIQAVAHTHPKLKMPPTGKLQPHEIANLEKWILDGAAWSETAAAAPNPESTAYKITQQQKAFWSFQPLQSPDVPIGGEPNPIDAFIAAPLAAKQLQPVGKAAKTTLIRRAAFDLTGLPPTPAEIHAFLADDSTDAFAKVVDRLLASPQYGQRWGRHWLDLVRYADTAGDASDYPVPEAWQYRNYVIDSFNRDKPYDQFVREQIAGDLLPYDDDKQRWEQTIATGYIAISRRVGVSPTSDRHVTIEDTIDNIGKTFLGLSVGCARCHDHKFDPIPTSDYYALYGILNSSVYPFAGEEHKPYRADFVYRIGKEKASEILQPYDAAFAPWKAKERAKFAEYQEFQNRKITTPGRTREVVWKELVAVREQLRPYAEAYPKLETAYAISEGKPQDARIQRMGDPRNPGSAVPRGFLQVLGGQTLRRPDSGSGRLELAGWLTDSANPLTARVIVNRVWHHHFGRGIVATTSDFGVRGAAPTHPELLDYLASRFVSAGWSFKKLHRLILLSAAYQRSSANLAANYQIDPQNEYLWRQNRHRLDAESISDSIRLLSAGLDLSPGGPHPFPNERTYFYRQHEPFLETYANPRRAVYGIQQRIVKDAYLDLFDGPDGNLPLPERRSTTSSLQTLFLMNSAFLEEQSNAIAERLRSGASSTPQRVAWAYERIFGRAPAQPEIARADEFLARLASQHRAAGCQSGLCEQKVWASYVKAMFSSNEFLFVD